MTRSPAELNPNLAGMNVHVKSVAREFSRFELVVHFWKLSNSATELPCAAAIPLDIDTAASAAQKNADLILLVVMWSYLVGIRRQRCFARLQWIQ